MAFDFGKGSDFATIKLLTSVQNRKQLTRFQSSKLTRFEHVFCLLQTFKTFSFGKAVVSSKHVLMLKSCRFIKTCFDETTAHGGVAVSCVMSV